MGIFSGFLFQKVAKKTGKALGKQVAKDIKKAENKWSLADKIKELATDSELSKSYIQGLISKSSSVPNLQSLKSYLKDLRRSGNLTKRERYDLVSAIDAKVKKIEDYKAFK